MSASIARLLGSEAFDLVYPDYISRLPSEHQYIMRRHMVNSSRCWIVYEDDKVLCFLGLIPPTILSDRAYLWLHTTEHLREHVFIFVRHSQRVVQEILTEYPIIVGHTEVTNTKAIRWLRWLGAVYGPLDGPLLTFEIRASQ